MENSDFEKNGLKIEGNRVLTYSKLSCPLDCTYCFLEGMTQEQEKYVEYLSQEQLRLIENLPENVRLIMLGCDTEFFQNIKNALDILNRLKDLRRDISVVTKLPLSREYIEDISKIFMQMRSNGNIFSLSISLPCLFSESVKKYEPTVPLPERRVSTLKTVHEYGIPAMVAIRPLLPDVSEEELLDIVKLTKDYVVGYYSGPLYLKKETVKFLLPDFVSDKEEKQPNWMLDGNTFQIIEKEGQMERLISIVEKSGRRFFIGAADGMDYIRNLEKYEKPRN